MSEDLKNIVPDTWVIERLGNFVISEKGKKPKNSSKEKSDKCHLPYVNIQAFEKNIVEEYTDGVGCVLCEEDDFLMVWDGSRSGYIGKAIKGALGSTLVKINFPGIVNDYAYYFLLSKYLQINTRAKGTGTPHVDPDLLWNYQFPIAPYNEQKRVVEKIEEYFSDLDKGIEILEGVLKQLRIYKRAVLNSAFEGRLVNKRDDAQPIKWEAVKIKDVADSLDHLRKPINKTERHKRQGDIPYYGANGRTGWIDNFLFDEPLVLVVEDETFIGRELPFSYKVTGKSWVNNHAHILKPKSHLDIDFLNYQLFYYPFLPLTIGTTGRKKLTKDKLMNAPFKYCNPSDQVKIVQEIERRLSVCDKIEELIETTLKQSEILRYSILKKAFEGKLVPQDSRDEPASALLKKIKAEREQNKQAKKVREKKARTKKKIEQEA